MDTIFISSHVKLPSNTTSQEVFKFLALAVEVNRETGIIMGAELTLVTDLGKDFIYRLAYGYNMNDGVEGLIEKFETHYYGFSKRAIETAFRMLFTRYEEIIGKTTAT